jgi:hypothetical protein
MTKIHFVEGDTDWAVSCSNSSDCQQGFKYVIKDHDFYDENIYKFTPSSFYSSNNNNPIFNSEIQKYNLIKSFLVLQLRSTVKT